MQKIKAVIKNIFSPYFYGHKIFETKSDYNNIKVVDKKGYRYLIFDDPHFINTYPEEIYQSCLYLKDPVETPATYAYYFHLAFSLKPDLKKVLMIGLGCGLIPLQFLHKYSIEEFHAVEIDAEVVKTAKKYFKLPQDKRFQTFVQDGRDFIENNKRKYHLLILDAFFARSLPFPLFTRQFFTQVKNSITEDGILTLNVNGAFTGRKSKLFHSLYKTIKESFSYISLFAAKSKRPEELQNIIIYAFQEKNLVEEGIQNLGEEKLNALYTDKVNTKDVEAFDDNMGLSELDIYGQFTPEKNNKGVTQ